MSIVQMYKWSHTRFVPYICCYTLPWRDSLHVGCSFQSFWPIPTVQFPERVGIMESFPPMQAKCRPCRQCHASSTHAHCSVCTCRVKALSFLTRYHPHFSACMYQTGFRAQRASIQRISNLRFEISPRKGLRAVTQKQNQFTYKWSCGAWPDVCGADLHRLRKTSSIKSRRSSLIMNRADGTSTARGKRRAGLGIYITTWW